MSAKNEPAYFSLLPVIGFGYSAYLLGEKIFYPLEDQGIGMTILFTIGLLSCLAMVGFLVVGFWRSWR